MSGSTQGGNDNLTGGAGADTFVYATGGGADFITDFNHGQGDRIDVTGVAGIFTLADIQSHATQQGANTFIDFGGGNTITLQNVTLSNLVASDFAFNTITGLAVGLSEYLSGRRVADVALRDRSLPEQVATVVHEAGHLAGIFGLRHHAQVVFQREELFQPQAENAFPVSDEDSDSLIRHAPHSCSGGLNHHPPVPWCGSPNPDAKGSGAQRLGLRSGWRQTGRSAFQSAWSLCRIRAALMLPEATAGNGSRQ